MNVFSWASGFQNSISAIDTKLFCNIIISYFSTGQGKIILWCIVCTNFIIVIFETQITQGLCICLDETLPQTENLSLKLSPTISYTKLVCIVQSYIQRSSTLLNHGNILSLLSYHILFRFCSLCIFATAFVQKYSGKIIDQVITRKVWIKKPLQAQ